MIRPSMRGAALTGAAVLFPLGAQAHNFAKGTFFPLMIDGIGSALNDPITLLTLIPVGLLASLWQSEGMLKIWPALLVGTLVGVPMAALATPVIAIPALLTGAVCALMAVLSARYPALLVAGLAGLAGLLATMTTLEGHGFFTLSIGIYAGIIIGANMIVAASAAFVRAVLEGVKVAWARIGMRILSSWTAAVTLMLLAFQFKA
jgi:hypothetical protein